MFFLSIYFSSLISSCLIEATTFAFMAKTIAQNGYKINFKNYKDKYLFEKDDLGGKRYNRHIPFFNILYAISDGIEYFKNPEAVLSDFYKQGIIEEMTLNEFNEYFIRPCTLRALKIFTASNIKKAILDNAMENSNMVLYKEDDNLVQIYYKIKKGNIRPTVISSTSAEFKLDPIEAHDKVKAAYQHYDININPANNTNNNPSEVEYAFEETPVIFEKRSISELELNSDANLTEQDKGVSRTRRR